MLVNYYAYSRIDVRMGWLRMHNPTKEKMEEFYYQISKLCIKLY